MSVDAFAVPVEQQQDVQSYLLRLGFRCETGVEPKLLLDPLTRAFASFLV